MNATVYRENALADYIKPRNYGEIIRYQEIERVTDTRRKTTAYYNAIHKAKKKLLEEGKMIVAIDGGDYRIVYPGDYSLEYAKEVRRAKNRVMQGKKILDNAPTKDMTRDELEVYNRVYDFGTRLSASMTGSSVEVKRLTGKQHPLDKALSDKD